MLALEAVELLLPAPRSFDSVLAFAFGAGQSEAVGPPDFGFAYIG